MNPLDLGDKSPSLKNDKVLLLNPIPILFAHKACCPTQHAI